MIKVDSISKKFKLYRSPADRLKEIITGNKYHTDFQALDDISFQVDDGETLGIIGQNGAGKSTLLKILTGILLPDSGAIFIDGKITGLLELGTGFNAEMTGIENIYMNGTLLGMSREEIDQKKNMVIGFTELGDFIYEQLKTYSSGMVMRLAFAIAIHADPKCFVVDEALSVGDAYFQQKCMSKIKEFRRNGGSIIFVSHDMNSVKMLCDRAVLLERGVVVNQGNTEAVTNRYNFLIAKLNDKEGRIIHSSQASSSYGTFEVKIESAVVIGEQSASTVVSSGEHAVIRLQIRADKDIDNITVGILIRDRFGQDIFGTNTHYHKIKVGIQKDRSYTCEFRMRMDIGPGKYTVVAALHSDATHLDNCFHWSDSVASFEVAGNRDALYVGVCKLYPEIVVADQNRA